MRVYLHILLLCALSFWLIWSGIRAIGTKRAYFGKGTRRYTGRKAVVVGYIWIALGVILLALGLIVVIQSAQ